MSDRTINFGESETEATYQIQDTDSTGGGNFVVAKDTNANTVLLQYDPATDTWEYAGDVDMNGGNVSGVGTLTAESVNTEDVDAESVNTEEGNVQNVDDEDETAIPNTNFVEDKAGGVTSHLVARDELTQQSSDISFSQDGLNAQREYIIRYVALPRSSGSVRLRFNDDDGANYHYWNESGTRISGEDKIELAHDDASAFAEHAARVHIYPGNSFIGVSSLIGDSRGRLNSFAQSGGYGSTEALESVEITFPGWTTDDNAFVELWEVV